MSPALALVEAAIVADRLQIASAGIDQLLQLLIRHERLDAIDAHDLSQDQHRERSLDTRRVGKVRSELRQEPVADRTDGRGGELLASHPRRERFERNLVTQRRIRAAEAGNEIQRKRLSADAVGDCELLGLQLQQLLA